VARLVIGGLGRAIGAPNPQPKLFNRIDKFLQVI